MKTLIPTVSLGCLLFAGAASANSETFELGKELHDNNCVRCHDSSMYTREESRIDDIDSLRTMVRGCQNNFDLAWFDDEVNAVAHYLNQKYYHFD